MKTLLPDRCRLAPVHARELQKVFRDGGWVDCGKISGWTAHKFVWPATGAWVMLPGVTAGDVHPGRLAAIRRKVESMGLGSPI